jgi:sialic acid synthase SpsE
MKIKIGNKIIGENYPPYIILEASSNWCNIKYPNDSPKNFRNAKKMVRIAKKCGADAIKFQLFEPKKTINPYMPFTWKVGKKLGISTTFELFERLKMPKKFVPKLIKYAKKMGIEFLATPFDKDAVNLLAKEKVSAIKIASHEITDIPFLEYCAKTGLPIILSTGIADKKDIISAIKTIKNTGNNKIAVLYCESKYPCPIKEINLARIKTLQKISGTIVGLSDHTIEEWVPALACVLGAKIIEKHFSLNKKILGPDQSFSIRPAEAKRMIKLVHSAHIALGSSEWSHSNASLMEYKLARRCLCAGPNGIKRGDKFILKEMTILRGSGILPRYIKKLKGRRAKKNYNPFEPVVKI